MCKNADEDINSSKASSNIASPGKCRGCGQIVNATEILDTAKRSAKAHINQKGRCSYCGVKVEAADNPNFCPNCRATFLTEEEISTGKVR